jgi:uncharacterized SAM-binding protein YcdF (DUF218 family)
MVTKFIEPWILLPGILILGLVLLGIALIRTGRHARGLLASAEVFRIRSILRRVRLVGWILIILAVTVYGLSTPAFSRLLLGRLERRYLTTSMEDFGAAQAVVVLGGGVIADAPSEELLSGDGRDSLSAEAESRLLYGMRLAGKLDVPMVLTGGRVFPNPVVEAEATVARRLLLDLGFPPSRIRVEGGSRTTAENARNTAETFSYTTVALVTSAYHMRRSVAAFSAAGLTVIPAPAAFRTDRRPLQAVHFIPGSGAFQDSSVYLRELVGSAYYAVRNALPRLP